MEKRKTELVKIIRTRGERLPKKHGDWFRLRMFGDNALAVYVVEKANTKRTYGTHNFLY
jgi:hypothetical protein